MVVVVVVVIGTTTHRMTLRLFLSLKPQNSTECAPFSGSPKILYFAWPTCQTNHELKSYLCGFDETSKICGVDGLWLLAATVNNFASFKIGIVNADLVRNSLNSSARSLFEKKIEVYRKYTNDKANE